MLKVECESCKAPYQIDERRVPAAGLKMRCPKCGHSFVVKSPGAAGAASPAAASPATPPVAPPARAATRPQAPPPPVHRPPPPPTKPSLPAALAMAPASSLDLPAVPADLPAPAPARPAGPVVQKRGATMVGVAGPAGALGVAPPPRVVRVAQGTALGIPHPAQAAPPPQVAPPAKHDFDLELPSFGAPAPGGSARHDRDLPALPGDLPALPGDLPAPVARKPQPGGGRTMAFGQADLPARAEAGLPARAEADLPARADAGLPARVDVGLPARADAGLPARMDAGLPSPATVGLPQRTAQPAIKRPTVAFGEIDLPSAANDLPAVASALPSVASALPSVANALPSVANALPAVANALPSVANALPSPIRDDRHLPSAFGGSGAGSLPPAFGGGADDFGELELPRAPGPSAALSSPAQHAPPMNDFASAGLGHMPSFSPPQGTPAQQSPAGSLFDENPFTSVAPPPAPAGDPGGFGELELPVPPNENKPASFPPIPSQRGSAMGGMSFGELDLGGGANDPPAEMGRSSADNPFGEASLGSVIQPPPNPPPMGEVSRVSQLGQMPDADSRSSGGDGFALPTEANIGDAPARPRRDREARGPRGPSALPKIFAALLGFGVIGGALMALTPYGAFGYFAITDAAHANEYVAAANAAVVKLHEGLKSDLFVDAEKMADSIAAARAAKPRARSLTAVAAIAELETQLRFGKDPDRANRAKLWLTHEIPEPRATVRYLDVANAAVLAIDRDKDKARAGFDAAMKKYAGDPIQQDIAFMRGQLELRSGDGAAAQIAFKKALELAPGARAHFGLAQAAFILGDRKTATKELGETIAASPKHGAALLVRSQMAWSTEHDDAAAEAALKDIATLLEGPAKDSISTGDAADAYASRGAIQFARGRTAEARTAFDEALKRDARNVAALIGQGDVLYDEGRFTEAITRYDTALAADPNSIRAMVGDAKTKLALEQLADAKTQLAAGVKKFPKSAMLMMWLGVVESALGNKKDGEKDFLDAIELVDVKDPDAIAPYAGYANFLAAQGRAEEAQAKLGEAQKKLPDSAGLQRSLGDVASLQGHHDEAIAHYREALEKDALDVSTRFRLGQALRRTNALDEASKVFDQVYAADKNFPGLSLERGLLFEQSGNVDKALVEFKTALDKHPNDPDLQLRVGAAFVAIGKPEDAMPMLKKVLSTRPNSAEAQHYLGRALMQEGPIHQQEAERALKTAAEKDPNRAEYHLYYGWVANMAVPPELGLAKKQIEKALDLDRTLADAYWQRGVLEYYAGANVDAIKDLKYALRLKPTRYEAHATLAETYEKNNQTDLAIQEWRQAFARDDENELWNYELGKLLYAQGQIDEAVKRLGFATGTGEKDQPRPVWLKNAEFLMAEALRKSGSFEKAVPHYREYHRLGNSDDPDRRDVERMFRQHGIALEEDR